MTTPIAWPYPELFAHRLGGALAPENTLAGLAISHRLGVRAAECDVRLSADDVPFLLHDDTLARTCDGGGTVTALRWAQLSQRDAGSRFHPAFAGEALPSLDKLATCCLRDAIAINLELKPAPGHAAKTGHVIAAQAARLWADATLPPLLSSFSDTALLAARDVAPALPRALLLARWHPDAIAKARHCHASALHIDYRELDADRARAVHAAGLALMAWTVNTPTDAARLRAWGVQMLCSDRPDRLLA